MSVITAADVESVRDVLILGKNDVVTPLARDRAKELGVRLERSESASASLPNKAAAARAADAPRAWRSAQSTPAHPGANGSATNRSAAIGSSTAAGTNRSAPPNGRADAVSGLPSATIRIPVRDAGPLPERSGALYRRGAYGLDGRRTDLDAASRPATARTRPVVAVIGAGHVGAATGIRLAESNVFEHLTLIDVVDGLAAGLALDVWHSAGLQRFTTRVTGSARIEDVAGADIVVISAGRPRKPGMTRTDLTAANAEIIRAVAPVIRERAPGAVVVVVTNPLEEMTHLTAKLTGFPPERVIGMGGVLDTARFRALIGLTGVARPQDVRAIVLGSHGGEMVVPLSQASANGVPLETLLDANVLADIVKRTRESGAEVTGLLQSGSAFVSPGSAIARQVEVIVRGADDIVPACVASRGAYGIRDVRIGLPVRLGPQGVREIVELPLRPDEMHALRDAAEQIRARTQALA